MIYTVLKFKMYIGEVLPQVDIEKIESPMLKVGIEKMERSCHK
jgi:hypothetical protein